MVRAKYLAKNENNIIYVAAYLRLLIDKWKIKFPEIDSRPDILGTLYNLNSHDFIAHT